MITYQQQANFIEEIAPIAQTLQKEYGILASISMAQAALESNFGESQLSAQYHNLYGVKTEASDPAGVDLPTLEFIDGEMTEMEDRFKVYPDWASSMRAHAELIYYGTTWDPNYYQAVKVGKDYQSQAQGLAEAGYATDPDYAQKLIDMIETWQLDQYDQTSP
ncbi:glycoside hydrolase family 73 protein [Ignavigranum ruoffiae]|uniref:glycoside hydrolase family 73 protein n=1 Tax=Ignavigranum ruoffiae TaxID=89093 RepID=UPI002070B637|nr:glycoside hydrolase family 73 protein [Ignavigranum ruoffiae]UPQ85181.1 glycoside hydrolase family 73 protein [Ignavigranum ruoffiae]